MALAAAAVVLGTGAGMALTGSGSASSGQPGRTASTASTATTGSTGTTGMSTSAAASTATTPSGVTNWDAEGLALGNDLLPGLSKAVSLGATPGSTMLTLAVGLAQPNPSGEQSLINQEYDPSSPLYHQFLTPAEFDAAFGVPSATVDSTEAWLQSGGLAVGYVSPAGDMVQARGTAAQVSALMHTSFGDYRVGNIGFVANRSAPEIPKALPITVVSGLNTLQRVWTEQQVDQADGLKMQNVAAQPTTARTTTSASGSISYVGTDLPKDLWGVYDAPASDTGQGETAGMFGAGYVNGVISVLRVYEQRTGLPQVPVRQVLESNVPNAPADDGDVLGDGEWDLDNEAISSMAPGLKQLDQYFASTEFDPDMAATFDLWAGDTNGPKQMNASFGECEAVPGLPPVVDTTVDSDLNYGEGLAGEDFQVLADPSLEQAVSEGRTLFAAAGDTGGSCPAVILPIIGAGNGVNPQPAPTDQGYPCVSAYATCVGGTVVTTNGTTNPTLAGAPSTDYTATPKRVDEQSWAFTGGGPAAFVPEPSWQTKVTAVNEPCTGPMDEQGNMITPGTVCRGVPDVAAMSGSGLTDSLYAGNNGYYLSIDDMPIATGGTSLSSPLTVGMWSRIQAASPQVPGPNCKKKGICYPGLGFADYTIYKAGESANYGKDFYDITSSDMPTGNFYQQPAAGWDYTSGFGAIDVANFISDVDNDPNLLPTHPVSATAAPPVSEQCSVSVDGPGNAYDTTITPPVGAYANDTQLAIDDASLAVSSDGKSLIVTIGGKGLSTTGPPDAIDGYSFYATWAYNGTTYYAGASVDDPQQLPATAVTNSVPAPVSAPTGSVTYGDGVINSDSPTYAHTDTGSFTQYSQGGYFTIDVPLSNVGSPGAGAALEYPFFWSVLPNGVLVPTALSEAVGDTPQSSTPVAGYKLIVKNGC